mgnify:CR=1 FL=1
MQNLQATIDEGNAFLCTLSSVAAWRLIGSAQYLPADQVNDVDFAVLLQSELDPARYATNLQDTGWGKCSEYDQTTGLWFAVRRGDLNLMLTSDPGFYEKYLLAMEVCQGLRLAEKAQRVAVCAIVRDGLSAAEARNRAGLF